MTDMRKIEEFLYDEAALLDNPDLDAWMGLFTEDGTYWMPVEEDQVDSFPPSLFLPSLPPATFSPLLSPLFLPPPNPIFSSFP